MRNYGMQQAINRWVFFAMCAILGCPHNVHADNDWRDYSHASVIPSENYADQPYIIRMKDGGWLCTITTGPGDESQTGQHIVSTTSYDQGKTWSNLVSVEPSVGDRMTSWSNMYVAPSGRIYVFYNYSKIRKGNISMVGAYCFKYSDDNAKTWSQQRYEIPIRETRLDHRSPYPKDYRCGWSIDDPIFKDGKLYIAFSKICSLPQQPDSSKWKDSGAVVLESDNIASEQDPAKIRWKTLPEGDMEICNPAYQDKCPQRVQTEFNLESLTAPGNLHLVCRTTLGFAMDTYSRDGGRTWSDLLPMTYSPDGSQVMKTPRACPRIWRDSRGRYLFWFHNHDGAYGNIGSHRKGSGFECLEFPTRNPVWISGGIEKEGKIHWSQPELLLYEHYDHLSPTGSQQHLGMSYPDFIEEDGRYWITTTNKRMAGIFEVPADFLEGMWQQGNIKTVCQKGLVAQADAGQKLLKIPMLDDLRGGSFSLDLWVKFDDLKPDQVLFDSRNEQGKGLLVTTTAQQTVELQLSDGINTEKWDTDPDLLETDRPQHITFIVDGQAKLLTVVVNDRFCDGGEHRPVGWTRLLLGISKGEPKAQKRTAEFSHWWGDYAREIRDVNGSSEAKLATKLNGKLLKVRLYNRHLTTSEAIANYHAGHGIPLNKTERFIKFTTKRIVKFSSFHRLSLPTGVQ